MHVCVCVCLCVCLCVCVHGEPFGHRTRLLVLCPDSRFMAMHLQRALIVLTQFNCPIIIDQVTLFINGLIYNICWMPTNQERSCVMLECPYKLGITILKWPAYCLNTPGILEVGLNHRLPACVSSMACAMIWSAASATRAPIYYGSAPWHKSSCTAQSALA
jgi:hypothetical protein